MNSSAIFDRTISQIQDRLNLVTTSHRIVSSNLANSNTPGFVARDVSFEKALSEATRDQIQMSRSHTDHVEAEGSSSSHALITEQGPVNLEQEMMKLARNSVEYQFMATMLSKKFGMLKTAITEGGAA